MPLTFISAKPVKYWDGSAWQSSQDFGYTKMWDGSQWRFVDVRPYADVALVTFDPAGGTIGSPTELSDSQFNTDASVTINASSSVVWNYTGGDGVNGYASVASGGSSSSITFFAVFTNGYNYHQFNVSASDGAETKYWLVTVLSDTTL